MAGPISINIGKVLKERLGGWSRLVPGFLVRRLERIICQDRLNGLLAANYPATGAEFCRGVLRELDVTVNVNHAERLGPAANRRVIIVSNHPLGGLDGMALIDWATERYGGQVWFVVNDLLNAVEPLRPVFLPINKHGGQSRQALRDLDRAMAGNDPILIFPAGLVSRSDGRGGICDLEWKKMFVSKAIEFQRDIQPVYFAGRNSDSFYSIARKRQRSGLKFNIEMIYLPREVFRAEHSEFNIICGKPIAWQQLADNHTAAEHASAIKNLVYRLAPKASGRTP